MPLLSSVFVGPHQVPLSLESTTDPIRTPVVEDDLVELGDRQVVVESPGLGAVEGGRDAAVATEKQVVGVARIDPERVVIGMHVSRSVIGEGFPPVVGAHEILTTHVDSFGVVGVDPNVAEVHRSWIGVGELFPGVAPICGAIDPRLAIAGFHGGEYEVAVPSVDVEADAPQLTLRKAFVQSRPVPAAVHRTVEAASRSTAVEPPRRAPARIHRSEERVRVRRVHGQVDRSRIGVQVQDQLPRVTTVCGLVDARAPGSPSRGCPQPPRTRPRGLAGGPGSGRYGGSLEDPSVPTSVPRPPI